MRRLVLLLILTSAAIGLSARPAPANPYVQLSIMMDDDQLIYRGDTGREAALQKMKALGVDYVRVTLEWKAVAAGMKKRNRKRAENPKAYNKFAWDRYDNLVRAGARYKIGIYFDVTGPGPRWAHAKAPKALKEYQDTWKPNPRLFARFVKAVGRRYDGTYRDENADRAKLPRVAFWSIYNEPNQAGWLMPQNEDGIVKSAVIYRDLWYYGRKALEQTGHGKDVILIGETAPSGNTLGNPASPTYPKTFIREFFCRDASNRPYRGAAARKRRCETLKRILPLRYTAWAHHPYTKFLAPTKRESNRNAITMANIDELSKLLASIKVAKDAVASANLVASTEFGYETDPPDPFVGISLKKQAEYLMTGDYIAYKDPSVIANTQFQLVDVDGVKGYPKTDKRHWFGYQSGLLTAKNKLKPSAAAYRMPLKVTAHDANSTSFWGLLRFLPSGVSTTVNLQYRAPGQTQFTTVGDPVPTSKLGYFEATRAQGAQGQWRAVFVNPYTKGVGGISPVVSVG